MVPDIEIAEQLPHGVAIYEPLAGDADFVLRYLNPAGAAIVQEEREALLGRRLSALFPGADDLGLSEALRRVALGGPSERLATRLYRDAERSFWVTNQVSRLASGALMAVFEERGDQVAAQAALRASEERYALAVAGANDGLWDWDLATDEVYFSPRWKEILGYRDDEIANRLDEWRERVHPDDLARVLARIDAHQHAASAHLEIELRMRRKDGSWCWILSRALCVRDAGGRAVRMAGSYTDIDARKRAEQQAEADRKRLATLFETVQTGITVIDLPSKRIVDANEQAAAILGFSREQLLGQRCSEWLCVEPESCPFRDQRPQILNREIHFRHRDGHLLTVLQSVVPLTLGDRDLLLESYVDISAQKAAQRELRAAKDAAEAAALAKSEFLAKMSHEIRTPMNSIIGMTQLTLDTDLDPEQRENLEIVDVSAEALLELIDDILDFSKIEAGHLELAAVDFDLPHLLEEILDGLSLRAAEKGLELAHLVDPGVPERVRGDPGRLRQVLINLAGNAVKFTERGEVVVHAQLDAADAGGWQLRFRITDTGIGVPAEQREAIFDAFAQVDGSVQRRYGGTGLGLSICRQLVGLMGGTIGLEPNPAGGSVFWFTVRVLRPQGDAAPDPVPASELAGLRCLIVDDTEANRLLLTRILARWQCRPAAVAGGHEALRELQRAAAAGERYDLMLLDMMMPGLDGEQTAHALRRIPGCGELPLLVLSSIDQRALAQRVAALGMSDHLLKPIKRSLLRDAMLALLARRRQRPGADAEQDRAAPAGAPMAAAGALADAGPLAGRRVLLVEDKPFNQRVASGFLQRHALAVTLAGDGAEAVAKAAEQRFDAILMDVQMPLLDGREATRRIRAREAEAQPPRHTPIIAMTAHAMSDDRDQCLAAGMDDYISKPIDPQRLRQLLARWVGTAETATAAAPGAHDEPGAAPPTTGASPEDAGDAGEDDPFPHLAALFGDDRATILEIVELFLEDAPAGVRALEEALAHGDASALQTAAHGMKGMVRNLGLEALGEQLLALEHDGRDGRLETGRTRVARIRSRLEALYPRLRARLEAGR